MPHSTGPAFAIRISTRHGRSMSKDEAVMQDSCPSILNRLARDAHTGVGPGIFMRRKGGSARRPAHFVAHQFASLELVEQFISLNTLAFAARADC